MSSIARSREAAASRPRTRSMRAAALPYVQPRARATRDALLEAGRALLTDRDFDALSVAELAGAAGLSVGSFYGRFRDKDSFFVLLQEQVTDAWLEAGRALLDASRREGWPARRLVDAICAGYLEAMRRDAGVVRASIKHASTRPDTWTPVKRTGHAYVDGIVVELAPKLAHLPRARREPRVRFAMQVLFGTGLNAVLNDPGPMHFADPRLEAELARMVAAYLELDG